MRREIEQTLAKVDSACRADRIPMLGPEKARFIHQLVREKQPELVVECGTAIGYSGIWICAALEENGKGRLLTLEIDAERSALAGEHFAAAGVDGLVERRIGDACELVTVIAGPIDFVLFDNGFSHYLRCFQGLEAALAGSAVLAADNAGIGAEQMADYLDLVRGRYESETHWFDIDLEWVKRDAVEVSRYTTQ